MSRTIDERIVSMKLNNSQFESRAKQSLGTLRALGSALKLDKAAAGLQKVGAAAKNFKLGNVEAEVGGLSSKFSALAVVGVTALATIANKAVVAGMQMAKSMAITPIMDGFREYELKMGSIQTILANTARHGTTLKDVTRNLDELNDYADQTIYNFGEMTRNIGLFTNAGIGIDDATAMIKGFSNAAATSGVSSSGAASAAYQLSQALSAGVIRLMDWKSLQNVGMGSKNMQSDLVAIAQKMGTFEGKEISAEKAIKNFNYSLEHQWLTADVMSKYLQIMAEDNEKLNRAQLKSIGITGKQADQFVQAQKTAQEAATKVRTLTQMFSTLAEGKGSGWAQSFEIVFGDFNSATKMFSGAFDRLDKITAKSSKARNDLLAGWVKGGGRVALIDGISNAFEALMIVINAVKKGFREIFPPTTADQLISMTESFRDFTESLKMGPETADKLSRVFAGFFAILKTGMTIVSFAVQILFSLFGLARGGSGGFLDLAASIGDVVVAIHEWLMSSKRIQEFFKIIDYARTLVIAPLINIVGQLAGAFADLFAGDVAGFKAGIMGAFNGLGALLGGMWWNATKGVQAFLLQARDGFGGLSSLIEKFAGDKFGPLADGFRKVSDVLMDLRSVVRNFGFAAFESGAKGASRSAGALVTIGEAVANVWEGVKTAFQAIKDFFGPFGEGVMNLLTTITNRVADFIANMGFDDILAGVNLAMFFMIFKSISGFFDSFSGLVDGFGGGVERFKEIMEEINDSVTGTLEEMQKAVKAQVIMKIAIALGILAASLWVLSTIDPSALARATVAMGALFFMLQFSMGKMLGMLDVIEGETPKSMGQIFALGAALMFLSAGVLLLSLAVAKLATLSWEEMLKGLVGVAALLAGLALFTKFADVGDMSIKSAASLVILAGAIYLLSFSVQKLGEMDQDALIQGSLALAAILTAMGLVALSLEKSKGGAGAMVLMAVALNLLVIPLMALSLMPFEQLATGLMVLGIALAGLTASAMLLGKSAGGAASFLAMAFALTILVPPLIALSLVPFELLRTGTAVLGALLLMMTISALALANPQVLLGAASILAIAAALAMLAPVVILLGVTPWETLVQGLLAMAAALLIVVAAGALAAFVAPGLAILSVALLALGAAMLMGGAGMIMFAAGFAALTAAGTAGFAILTAGFTALLGLIPILATQVGLGIIAIAKVIAASGPAIINAITTVLISFLRAIERSIPQFQATMTRLIKALIDITVQMTPYLAARGAEMIVKLLTIIGKYVGPMAAKATDLMISFINAIADNVPRLVDAGAKAVIDLINGVADAIRGNQSQLNAAGKNLASAIVEGMVSGIGSGISAVTSAARDLAKNALDAAKGFLGIKSPSREFKKIGRYSTKGFLIGLQGNKKEIKDAMDHMQDLVKDSMEKSVADIKKFKAKLDKLKRDRPWERKKIRETEKELKRARDEYNKASRAKRRLKSFKDEEKALVKLSKRYDRVNAKFEEAQKKFKDARKEQRDFQNSIRDSFDNMPSFDAETKLPEYINQVEKQIVDTQIFHAQMNKLRELGLNDSMYRQFLDKGTDAIPFLTQLLDQGKAGVKHINSLEVSLDRSAKKLGKSSSTTLYQAGVDAARGIVEGLRSQRKKIDRQMKSIAKRMVKQIKRSLGIRSPSREFAKVANWSTEGLVKGFKDSTPDVAKAADQVGKDTLDAFRKSLVGIGSLASSELDADPTIRPVLDLSAVKRDASQIGTLLDGGKITASSSYQRASVTAADIRALQNLKLGSDSSESRPVTFNQYNNSPKALSEAEIYRNTKNQISAAKGALKN